MVAVGDVAADLSVLLAEQDADEAGFGGRDAMLEGILYQRDEDEGRDGRAAVGRDVEARLHADVLRQADAHQFDVVAVEVHLLVQRDRLLLVLVEDVAEQAAQFLHGGLRLVRVEGDEGVDVVQRVQQEVRVQLAAQVLQFGFGAAFLGFAAGILDLRPSSAQPDGGAQADGEHHGERIAQEEEPFGRSDVEGLAGPARRLVAERIFLPEVRAEGQAGYQQDVYQDILFRPPAEEIAGDEKEIVGIEHDEERQRHDAAVAQVVSPRQVDSAAAHHQVGETEDDAPADDVDGGFDVAQMGVGLFHTANIVIIWLRVVSFFNPGGRLRGFWAGISPRLGGDISVRVRGYPRPSLRISPSVAHCYSYRMASMGSSCAAFLAGYQPKNTPVTVQTAKDRNTLHAWM